MIMNNTIYWFLLALIISFNTTQATEIFQCDVVAIITDQDPKGLNVRSAPNKDIISKIPITHHQPEESIKVHIVGSDKNWLKINQWFDSATTATFNRNAWIYNQLVTAAIPSKDSSNRTTIYMEPTLDDSKIVGQLDPNKPLKIVSCQDQWVFVAGKAIDGSKIKGWLPP